MHELVLSQDYMETYRSTRKNSRDTEDKKGNGKGVHP
jgi:hypothetical protein